MLLWYTSHPSCLFMFQNAACCLKSLTGVALCQCYLVHFKKTKAVQRRDSVVHKTGNLCVKRASLSGDDHANSITSRHPNIRHHQDAILLGLLTSFVSESVSPHLPLSHSVTLLRRTWWKWLFNHAERSANQRARAEWFKGLFRAQLEGEGKGGRGRERRVGVWLLYGTGHLSST